VDAFIGVPAPAQAWEGPDGAKRRKGRQHLKMEGVALQVWKVLEDGRCCTPRLEGADLGIKLREISKVNQTISRSRLGSFH
jgi:hypothetical protein